MSKIDGLYTSEGDWTACLRVVSSFFYLSFSLSKMFELKPILPVDPDLPNSNPPASDPYSDWKFS